MAAAQRLLRVTALNALPAAYRPILRLQELLFEQRKEGLIPDTLLLLEHQHVYTMGKRGSPEDFYADPATLRAAGAQVCSVPRGGETTYHGPGQLVAYPIVSLRAAGLGARSYVEGLEDSIVRTVGRYGISARGRVPGKTGVWVGERKIAAIGVRISQGNTSHGMALNVCTDLSYFRHIVPCGTPDKDVTSVHRQLGVAQWRRQQQQQQEEERQCQHQHGYLQQQQDTQKQQQQQTQAAAAAAAAAAAPHTAAPSVSQVAANFVDAFAAHFGYNTLEPLPDVNQLALELGCSGEG